MTATARRFRVEVTPYVTAVPVDAAPVPRLTELAAAAHDARNRAMLGAGVTAGALLAAILLALLVSRLLLTPIHRVREAALAVAHAHLPDAVARIRKGEEPAIGLPVAPWVADHAAHMVSALRDLGVSLVGSWDDLTPVDVPGVDPATVSDSLVADAAIAGLAGLLAEQIRAASSSASDVDASADDEGSG